ncbi:phage tail tip lysozyme [Fibrella sp. WM1]|uniref:transglycosylase SLT domain-containing protein n=1 Tax=Fibrella musci TaxID=3242485 RepID=UPI003521DCDD
MKEICTALAIDPDWLMATMWVESGLKPTAYNQNGGASGLIQFMPSTARRLGTTTAAIRAMTATAQLDYVLKYLASWKGKMRSAFDVYLAVHFPAALGKPDSEVLYSKTSTVARWREAYANNANIDTKYGNNDGAVSVADVKAFYYALLKGVVDAPKPPLPEVVRTTPDEPPAIVDEPRPRPVQPRDWSWVPYVTLGLGLVILIVTLTTKKISLKAALP